MTEDLEQPEWWVPTQRRKVRGKVARRPGRRSCLGAPQTWGHALLRAAEKPVQGAWGPSRPGPCPGAAPPVTSILFPSRSTWWVDRMCSAVHHWMTGTLSILKSCLCSWKVFTPHLRSQCACAVWMLSGFSRVWLCDPMDCSLPGSSVHGILQARVLEWVTTPSSGASSWPRDWTCVSHVSCTGRRVTWEGLMYLGSN